MDTTTLLAQEFVADKATPATAPGTGQAPALTPERAPAGAGGQPAWVTGELPPQYGELANKIAALRTEARKYEDIAAVLWQIGKPLTLAVRALFAALQFETELMEDDASCDVRVKVEGGRRLLVEVVGGPESIHRKSPQIGQIFRALQEDAGEEDRVVIAANAYCELPLAGRRQEPVSADALKLIQRVGANFVTTSTLFGIWRYSLTDLTGARKSVIKLHAQDGGVFK